MNDVRLGFDESVNCVALPKQCAGTIAHIMERFKNGSGCERMKRTEKLVGAGQYGRTYPTCCDGKCRYLTKRVKFHSHYTMDMFLREIYMQNLVHAMGLAPRILDTYITKKEGYIVMEFVDGQLFSQAKHAILSHRTWSDREKSKQLRQLTERVGKALSTLHQNSIVHGDSHDKNIFVEHNTSRVMLIDFGRAFLIPTGRGKKADLHYIERDYQYACEGGRTYPSTVDVEEEIFDTLKPFFDRDKKWLKTRKSESSRRSRRRHRY